MSSDPAKERLYQAIGRVAAALGNAGRLQLLEFVAQGERSVDALAQMTGLSVANTSKHLQALRQAGLVNARKEGLLQHCRRRREPAPVIPARGGGAPRRRRGQAPPGVAGAP
jgi:DNA-binding transcriptional ArsR family regulator